MNKLRSASRLACLATAIATAPALLAQVDEQALKELRILGGIFETVMEEETSGPGNFFRGQPDILYLPGEGAVITLSVGSGFFTAVNAIPGGFFNYDADVTITAAGDPAAGTFAILSQADEASAQAQETAARQNQAVAEARQQIAEQEAQVAQINAQLRQAMVEQQTVAERNTALDLEELKQRLRLASEGLREKQQALTRSFAENRERAAEEQRARAETIATTLTVALCDYGRTLRAIDNDEFVTLVLKNFSGQQSRVMLFDAREVKSCNDADALLEGATVYDM